MAVFPSTFVDVTVPNIPPRWSVSVDQNPTPIHTIGDSSGPTVSYDSWGGGRNFTIRMDTSDFIGEPATVNTASIINDEIKGAINYVRSVNRFTDGDTIRIESNMVGCTSGITANELGFSSGTGSHAYITSIGEDNITFGVTGYSKEEIIKQEIKRYMKTNLLIKKADSRAVRARIHPGEVKARKTLRDLVSERSYRRYLTNGFVMVQSQSGLYYQVFCDSRHTKIWDGNKVVGEICINTDRDCPPTDHVINIKMMVEFDELSIWNNGNLKNFDKNFKLPFKLDKSISYKSGLSLGLTPNIGRDEKANNLIDFKQELERKYA